MGLAEKRTPDARPVEGETLLLLDASAAPARGAARVAIGRAVELAVTVLLIVLSSPLLVLGMAIVAIGDGRPIFFGHERVGMGGRPFRCWKLRTMRADAEQILWGDAELHRRYLENGFKLPGAEDPRLIPGGHWLRRRYVDELPQLGNILKGDMALVGWRPVVSDQFQEFERSGENARAMLRDRPGLFGAWTSEGRSRTPDTSERVRLEVDYVNDPSLRRTVRILARSVGAVLAGQGEEG